ncbi:MAG TPA: hypothetical protein VFL91_13810, partial [Thermomicrobiales bacterium]|nr:hypothetical protein [Thermomicrobiales bacterium]
EAPAFLRACAARGLAIDAVARRDLVNEVLTVYRLKSADDRRQSVEAASVEQPVNNGEAGTAVCRLPSAVSSEAPC